MPYRAENIEDLDWTFHKDGKLQRETLAKHVLSTGAWPVIAYLYRLVKDGVPEERLQICLIRYARKKARLRNEDKVEGVEPPKLWVPYHRLNLPSRQLAWRIAAQILEWTHPEDVDDDSWRFTDVVKLLRETADADDLLAAEKSRAKRKAAWARRRAEKEKETPDE